MMRYALYRRDTGRITCVCEINHQGTLVDVNPDAALFAPIEVTDPAVSAATHYVANGEIVERPAFPAAFDKLSIVADGADAATLSPLPAGALVRVDRTPYAVQDGSLVIRATTGGTYHVTCTNWPCRDFAAAVTATVPEA